MNEKIIIVDFGSPSIQLICRKIRELNVYCEIVPYNRFPENDPFIKGVVFSDSPYAVHEQTDLSGIQKKYPVLFLGPSWGELSCHDSVQTPEGLKTVEDFLSFCGCSRLWTPAAFIAFTVNELKKTLRNDKVILALSGGVDSTVTALLLHKAIGAQLICLFVDHGLLRKNEFSSVLLAYKEMGLNIKGIDAREQFYTALAGVTDPEQKRKIIGKGFIDVFEREANQLKDIQWLGQGTIYPDVIESLSITGMVIKSHHNVGGLPEKMNLKLIEPLRLLFKDEVRRVGYELGIPKQLVARHPFPGPGLGIRLLGDITPEKVHILQEADEIFISLLRAWDLYDQVWQAAAILLPIRSVGVSGDKRTYEYTVVLRAVHSIDAMTAQWAHLPHDFLAKVADEIMHNVDGVNRVVYDISSKPPATIEWE